MTARRGAGPRRKSRRGRPRRAGRQHTRRGARSRRWHRSLVDFDDRTHGTSCSPAIDDNSALGAGQATTRSAATPSTESAADPISRRAAIDAVNPAHASTSSDASTVCPVQPENGRGEPLWTGTVRRARHLDDHGIISSTTTAPSPPAAASNRPAARSSTTVPLVRSVAAASHDRATPAGAFRARCRHHVTCPD